MGSPLGRRGDPTVDSQRAHFTRTRRRVGSRANVRHGDHRLHTGALARRDARAPRARARARPPRARRVEASRSPLDRSRRRARRGRRARARVAARATAGDDTEKEAAKGTLDSLSSILGIDPEEEAAKQRAEEERIEREVMAAKKEQEEARAARATGADASKPNVINRAASSSSGDGDARASERAIAALSYLLPLLDGLKYSKFLLLQFPLFGLALLPLKPAIDLWFSLGFLQILVFFGLYLGVVQNREMSYFARFNAQQAVLLDILLIVPDVLARLVSGLGGDDALLTGGPGLEAQVLMYNTVFLYVYLTSVVGVGASALGKSVKLPLVGDAAESQTDARG